MNMSLLKIPLILSSAIGVHISLTPPNAPPSKNEVVHNTLNEQVLILHVKYGLSAAKVCNVQWSFTILPDRMTR